MENYTWRTVQESDLLALEDLDAACLRVDGPVSVSGPAYGELLATSGVSMLCASVDSANQVEKHIVAVGWTRPVGERVWLGGKVHPQNRRMGLGTYLLRWTEEQAQRLHHPSSFNIVNEALTDGSAALYAQEGYSCNFIEYWMQRSLLEPLPAIEPVLPSVAWNDANAAQFYTAYIEAFRERRQPDAHIPEAHEWIGEYVEDPDFRPDLSLVALDDGKPIGFIMAGVMHIADLGTTVGWVSQVGSDPAWRGRGVAAGLIVQVMRSFKQEGFDAVGLHVNANNPGAIRVYERLGFVLTGRRAKYSKPNVG